MVNIELTAYMHTATKEFCPKVSQHLIIELTTEKLDRFTYHYIFVINSCQWDIPLVRTQGIAEDYSLRSALLKLVGNRGLDILDSKNALAVVTLAADRRQRSTRGYEKVSTYSAI